MEMLSGGDMIVRALEDEGVDTFLGIPVERHSTSMTPCLCRESPPHFVRHEQAATHAADGYARATGKPGVVLALALARPMRSQG